MVVDPPRDQVLDRGAAAAIRNVRDLEPGRGIEERAGKVRRRTRAGRAVLHLVGIGLSVGDELREIIGGQRCARDQNHRLVYEQRDWGEIGGGVVTWIFVERLVLRR